MLTRSGFGALCLASVLLGAGWILGVADLYYLAAGIAALVGLAAALVWLRPVTIAVTRTVEPDRVAAGSPSSVFLRVDNTGRFRTPVLDLLDAVTNTNGARLLVPSTRRNASHRARYELPTDRRGEVTIGPLEVRRTDPFGLSERRWVLPITATLVVHPKPADTGPPPRTLSLDPRVRSERSAPVLTAGDDFYTLRNYTPGDDLRRVHWPASARRDQLVVRQDELAWHGRIVVVIDNRTNAMPPRGLDVAVEIAAGMILAALDRTDEVRMLDTAGNDTDWGSGDPFGDECLRRLAVMQPRTGSLTEALANAAALSHASTTLVVVTSLLGSVDVEALTHFGMRSTMIHLAVDQTLWQPDATPAAHQVSPFSHVLTGPADVGAAVHDVLSAKAVA